MKRLAIIFVAILLAASAAFSQGLTDRFWVTIGFGQVLEGGGTGYNNGEWYIYPSMWINQWFYDHPFDPIRSKIIHVSFDWTALDPMCPTDITVALNWSTPEWSALGNGPTLPPLPGVDEELYIVRQPIMYQCGNFPDIRHFETDYIIYAYNPEWVSIDVRGCNFVITNGIIVHECTVDTEESSWGAIKANF